MNTLDLLKQLKMLYVEDDALTSEHMTMLMDRYCSNITHVDNALTALDLLKNETFHLVISDIVLEGMSGLELCQEIRNSDQNIPLVITSNFDDKEKLLKAVPLQLIDYLVKPVSTTQLKEALFKVIQWMRDRDMLEVKLSDNTTYFPLQKIVKVDDEVKPLTQKESQLMELLVRHHSRLVTREHIENHIYDGEVLTEPAYKNIIYRLRKKVGKKMIVSISGLGILLHNKNMDLERYM